MHLQRCKDQKSGSLEDFYSRLAGSSEAVDRGIGATMLSLIKHLTALPDDRRLFGLTSHYTLCLLASDSYESAWLIRVIALDPKDYVVEYLMPARIAPWPNAYVRGEASSEEDAVKMILTAMDRCEGWGAD